MMMNLLFQKRVVAMSLCGLMALGVSAQGPLTPPGAPGATMKTLGQLEPRTAISNANYTISQPGSYYLTTNLTATEHGIIIASDGVTLDLNGFSLTGDQGAGEYGLYILGDFSSGYKGITVRNGSINRFNTGARLQHVSLSCFENLSFSSNNYGIILRSLLGQSSGNRITHCRFSDSVAFGVYVYAASSGQCNGNTFSQCSITGSGGTGLFFFTQTTSQCNGNRVTECRLTANHGEGIVFNGSGSQCNGNVVSDCIISDNQSAGVALSGSNSQCDGNRLVNCVLRKNSGAGIVCVSADGNRIEQNVVSETTGSPSYGIQTTMSSNNLVVRNICSGQTSNFDLGANDTYGPIVEANGALATNGVSAHPWANFSR